MIYTLVDAARDANVPAVELLLDDDRARLARIKLEEEARRVAEHEIVARHSGTASVEEVRRARELGDRRQRRSDAEPPAAHGERARHRRALAPPAARIGRLTGAPNDGERVRAREALKRVGVATELHQREALEAQRARRRLGRRTFAFEHLARELHDALEVVRAAHELAAQKCEASSDDGVGLQRVRNDDCGCLRDCGGAWDVGCAAPVVVARGAAGAADRAAEQQAFGSVDECRSGRERLSQWPRQRAETFGDTVRVARRAEAERYMKIGGIESEPRA